MKLNSTKHFILIVSIIMILSSFYTLYNFGYNYAERHIDKRKLNKTDDIVTPIVVGDVRINNLSNCSTL